MSTWRRHVDIVRTWDIQIPRSISAEKWIIFNFNFYHIGFCEYIIGLGLSKLDWERLKWNEMDYVEP